MSIILWMVGRYTAVVDRAEALIARYRQGPAVASPREIDDLYTEACATALVLGGERLDVERRLEHAIIDASEDAIVIRRSRDLAKRRAEIDDELSALSSLTRSLSTAADWSREPESASVADLIS